ncbi:hypothetical protein Pryu01_02790 [Paraliobacillus ryukyuensis]|uniref:Uncharacterized protein n=1 Tax=Paraliobacillus ryukyuensis TaxID=200904 RepID=A0A366DSY5_9BACI|nr:hypothetical protein [Paraliobacillus ryukyuensis]RBO93200.1 hypothetical protein DES48_1121 [Paraliobacillus ryukyuensis]
MLGLLVNDIEQREMEYLIKRELEELLFDMQDPRIDSLVKTAMNDRYRALFQLLRRVASNEEVQKYIPQNNKYMN